MRSCNFIMYIHVPYMHDLATMTIVSVILNVALYNYTDKCIDLEFIIIGSMGQPLMKYLPIRITSLKY